MNVITRTRAAGKTYNLIKTCAEHNGIFIVPYAKQKKYIEEDARKMGLDNKFKILSWDELPEGIIGQDRQQHLFIDNVDTILARLCHGYTIDTITINGFNI